MACQKRLSGLIWTLTGLTGLHGMSSNVTECRIGNTDRSYYVTNNIEIFDNFILTISSGTITTYANRQQHCAL